MPAIRSLLFVPGDSERKLAKVASSGADAVILDLEDAVAPDRKRVARDLCREALAAGTEGPRRFVRVNALDTGQTAEDLAAVMPGAPFGIVLPKCQSVRDLQRLDAMLAALEAREGLAAGCTRVLPIITETAVAMLGMASYALEPVPRLFGMTWGAEDLAADLGAVSNRDETGGYAPPFQHARSCCLYAAAASGAAAIDAVFTGVGDDAGLEREAAAAARSGFMGKMAIHPGQVPVINRAFTPAAADVEQARRVMDAFAAAGGAGVATLDGRMLDRPHRRAAERVLAAAGPVSG